MELPYYAIEITNLFPSPQRNPGILPRTPSFAKLWRWIATLASSRAPGVWYLGEAFGRLRVGRAEHVEPVEDEKIFQLPGLVNKQKAIENGHL